MTKQETFDTVVAHLRKQGRRATDRSEWAFCMYRTEDGMKCAVGCLIPDEKYSCTLEGMGLSPEGVVGKLMVALGHDLSLLRDLQHIHDDIGVEYWEARFKFAAHTHGLTYTR